MPTHPDKVFHVYGTKNREKNWDVLTSTGRTFMPLRYILKHKLIDENTTYDVLRVSCRCRHNGKIFRYVWWKGFKKPTKEPLTNL